MMRTLLTAVCAILLSGPVFALQPPSAQSEYVPAAPGASTEQLPAGPLLVAAYAFVWVAAMGYVWTIGRRLTKVEDDIRTLERKAGKTSR